MVFFLVVLLYFAVGIVAGALFGILINRLLSLPRDWWARPFVQLAVVIFWMILGGLTGICVLGLSS